MAIIARDERSVLVPEPHDDDRATPEEFMPPARSRLVKANIKYLSALIQQLVELRNEPERDEYGALRATKQAFDLACTLLIDAAIVSAVEDRQIPYGCVSTDSQGGIRVEWVRESASVHIIIPASEERDGYVYHEEAANYGTEPATAEALARWLRIIKD